MFVQENHLHEISESSISTSSMHNFHHHHHHKIMRNFAEEETDHKNIFSSAMYAHLACHTETEAPDVDERNNSKRLLQYYPQQFHHAAVNSRSSSPPKTPFTQLHFPASAAAQQIYNGHMSNDGKN